ncbi:TetR/AcrR family transcriptional regulator [Actinocrispum sp. NPDC049592]|uniref:TetR/AcrR family transcriptional regulator n=1 Tax=Actinocrispum sp. NPDC049592 TaxID=3154835 RepID=UPI00342FFACB
MAGDVRKNMIVSATLLIRERGIAGTSLADVIEHSGAPRGSIYHHFPGGKSQLAEEATRWAGTVINRKLRTAANDPVALVRMLFSFWRKEMGSEFGISCAVLAAALADDESPEAHQAAAEALVRWTEIITEVLTDQGIPTERAYPVATLIVSAIEGAVVMARAQRTFQPLDRVETELVRLLNHLLPTAPDPTPAVSTPARSSA